MTPPANPRSANPESANPESANPQSAGSQSAGSQSAAPEFPNPKALVRRGYDIVSHAYRADDAEDDTYTPWIAALLERLPGGADVLDLGCGCGVPVARDLSGAGHAVVGVDVSEVQVRRARGLVPRARFRRADAVDADFPSASFDAVVCLYMLIHLPLAEQPVLLSRIAGWLRPGGTLLVVAGDGAWTGIEEDWLGGGAPMWWSHPGKETYREWITAAGLSVEGEEFVPEGDGGHALFWARKPGEIDEGLG
ncbi:bifunctional 2-polyprenyl-6-hydroxyphenol methylase/3-demethylubiquinol 3-O-methyltransferase UbiG [Streptomyces rimosus]|uniref:class I SAM-dependent methyltransferase n=1 Tax=Streptomyces rimosus TaxID=1927 RepID=UPI001F209163|nr:class I SAM-dependent methyltransferase [Streptomyces rimosus]